MTLEQLHKIGELYNCKFLPGSFEKSLVKALHNMAMENQDQQPSPKQAYWLEQIYHRYRRQIPNHAKFCLICGGKMDAAPLRYNDDPGADELDKLAKWKQSCGVIK